MARHTLVDALQSLVPNAMVKVINNEYDTMVWDSNNTDTKPTQSQINTEIARLDNEYDAKKYQRQRVNDISERAAGIVTSYPALEEQLDKLFHDIDAGKLDKTGDFYKALKEVKDTFPKPS